MNKSTFFEELDDYLAHYGVKGMKWGVRKRSSKSSRRKAKLGQRKNVKDMTDEELNEAIRRLEKERRYKDLKGIPTASKLGEVAVNALFNGVGQGIASVPKYGIANAGKWALQEILPDIYIDTKDTKDKKKKD